MKYIATAATGYVLMSRDIEVEIDEAKLEAALDKAMHDEDDWEKPADEWWIDFEMFANYFWVDDDIINRKADTIFKKWEALPDCIKVRDCNIERDTEQVNHWRDESHVQACQKWLQSKGWAPLPDDDGIWFRKK